MDCVGGFWDFRALQGFVRIGDFGFQGVGFRV